MFSDSSMSIVDEYFTADSDYSKEVQCNSAEEHLLSLRCFLEHEFHNNWKGLVGFEIWIDIARKVSVYDYKFANDLVLAAIDQIFEDHVVDAELIKHKESTFSLNVLLNLVKYIQDTRHEDLIDGEFKDRLDNDLSAYIKKFIETNKVVPFGKHIIVGTIKSIHFEQEVQIPNILEDQYLDEVKRIFKSNYVPLV